MLILTQEQIVIGRSGSFTNYCGLCATESRFFQPEIAARLSGRALRSIFRGVEDGSLHFFESADSLYICSRSLEETRRLNVISIDGDVP